PQRDQFIGLRLRVPLPIWNRNQGRIAEARAGQKRSAAKLAAAELAVRREVEAAWSQVKRLEEAVEAYRGELIGLSDRNVALIKSGYADGLVGITELVQAQQQSANIRQRYYGALGQLWKARIDLQTASVSDPLVIETTEKQQEKP
ncbi:MAG: TolC family protein, partial [Deltaproteobacteria bacterium]|nr:TolC family protein [Deltaproteobacteria bacterium]